MTPKWDPLSVMMIRKGHVVHYSDEKKLPNIALSDGETCIKQLLMIKRDYKKVVVVLIAVMSKQEVANNIRSWEKTQ